MNLANVQSKIYVAGHSGMVGSAIVRILQEQGFRNIVCRAHEELDLINQHEVRSFFEKERPDQVYLAAARVGGIYANNSYPAEFIYQNLMIESNIIDASFKSGVKRLLFLGSSCIYPRNTEQPIKEEKLMSGKLESTNEPYAIAKIAGIKLCESYNRQYSNNHQIDYRSIMPTNLYGPGDNYDIKNSHVIPALIRRFHEAKVKNESVVTVWGTGKPRREFLYVDDMALACIHVMNTDEKVYRSCTEQMCSHINVGTGKDLSIFELATLIKEVTKYKGNISFDSSKPDGTPSKLLDSNKINNLGWSPKTSLEDGLLMAYKSFQDSYC